MLVVEEDEIQMIDDRSIPDRCYGDRERRTLSKAWWSAASSKPMRRQ
jgi:hypothetical protein